jgi:hypothetical protein
LSRDTLGTRRDNAGILRTRTERGLSTELELQQALGAVAAIEAQIADLARSRAIAENQLGLLSGQLDLTIASRGSAQSAAALFNRQPGCRLRCSTHARTSGRRKRNSPRPAHRSAWRRLRCTHRFR